MKKKAQYERFIRNKSQFVHDKGFEPNWIPDWLHDFQKFLVEWTVRKGRAAVYANCGLGKTPMQLVWAQNVVKKTGKSVMIATPLAVGQQTVAEAAKFGIEAELLRAGRKKLEGGRRVT